MKKHLIDYNKPNVLMIGPHPPPYGGIAVVVRDLIDSSLKDNFNLKLLKTTSPSKYIKVRCIGEFWRVFRDSISLLKKLIFFRPRIVHVHTSYDWGWPKHIFYAIISKIFGSRVILHIHAYHIACQNKFPEIWLKRFIFPPKFVFNILDCIFTLSDCYTENIHNYTYTPVITIPNGIILKKFLGIDKQKKKSDFLIAYIGTLEKRKGIYELMEVIPQLTRKLPSIKFIIAGDGPAKKDIINWQKTYTYKNFCYLGKISEDMKVEVLSNSSVFVLQSSNEGMPISLLEAMAAGCTVITTPVGRIRDVIKDGVNGIIIPPEDKNNLILAITRLYKNRKLLKKIQENNLKEILKYSWEELSIKISEEYLKIYNGRINE